MLGFGDALRSCHMLIMVLLSANLHADTREIAGAVA
jgi:hypothetical protein